jgi:hypothetical protein
LQGQDNQIVQAADTIFQAHRMEIEAIRNSVTNCEAQILSIKRVHIGIETSLKDVKLKIIGVMEVMDSIKYSLNGIPSKRKLREHMAVMDDQLAQTRELHTGLTTAMEGLKLSESASFN